MGISSRSIILLESIQRREEGCNIQGIEEQIKEALAKGNTIEPSVFDKLYDELDGLVPDKTFPYEESSQLDSIRAQRPKGPRSLDIHLSDNELLDRIYGAWLGRAAGCALGKPVEGWPKNAIDSYLEAANALPLDDYIPYIEHHHEKLLHGKISTRGNIRYMERDDDMDYPILGLVLLERKGIEFTPRDMAYNWVNRMPFALLYSAERAAYRNFINNIWPPESAVYRNPYREWIGAQIRADIFGYVTPGWPEKGAELGFRDASISHTKNGIYGEMFVAAMLSAAFATASIDEIIEIGLSEIPANCRLAEAVKSTAAWCREESDWEKVWDRINKRYGHYHEVHTINNAALVVMGLLFGADDYEAGVVAAVRGGWDTDCNGATVGSILGAKFGAKELPQKWVGVFNDRLISFVRDCNDNKISDLAMRTLKLAKKIIEEKDREDAVEAKESPFIGSWSFSWRKGKAELAYKMVVKPDLSGSFENMNSGEIRELTNVRSVGNTVGFSTMSEKGGWEIEASFRGVITADTLKGYFSDVTGEIPVTGSRI